MSDGLQSQCMFWIKNFYIDNQDRLLNEQKLNDTENRDKINTQQNEYKNEKCEADNIFRLICRTRSRIYEDLREKRKSSSTKELLGADIDTYRR